MSRLSFRRIIRRPIALLPLILNVALFLPQPASAELYTTTGANDFYFTIETQQQFTVRAYAQQYGIDSMLWLYNSADQQLAANDDYFGLDSYISIALQAGTYRLRTGVCCGDPNRWYGSSYQIDTNFAVVGGVAVTTTTSTTTTEPPTTTTEPPTTTTQEPTTTTEASTTTVAPPTTETTVLPTTVPETTTTSTVSLPTSTEPEPTTTTSELLPTSTTQPDVPETTSTTTSTVADTTTTQAPETTLPPETTTSSTSTSTTVKVPTVTTSSEPVPMRPVATTQPVVVVTTTTTTSEPAPQSEQVGSTTTVPPAATLPEVLPELSQAEAVELALSSEVIQNATPEQAAQIFESIDTGALTTEQAEQLVATVQGADEEVRKEFESSVNIFDTKFETYVPVGSVVNVKTRKVIIAATGVLFVAPTISTSPPSSSSGGPSGGSGGSPSGSTSGESTGSNEKRQSRRGRK